ncbi:MAG: hypothetical protein HYS21_09000 [Deltaproteobacteria bacterium]|nr:hypothetical protein [Deltaproteobacteria bacterium]
MIRNLIYGLGGYLQSNSLDRGDDRVQAAIWFLIIVCLAVVISLMACGVTGTLVFTSGWFWAGAFGVGAIAIIDWLRKKDHTATIYRVAVGILVVGILMLIIRVAQPDASIKSAAEAFRASHANGSNAIQESDSKIYTPGEYTFSLRSGEMTSKWLMFPEGMMTNFKIGSSDDKFQLIYDDGQIVPAWTPEPFPQKSRTKFKIVAVTDQPEIKLTVR